jgi:phospholipid/cholesterol/gamma-HCH transport system substrate-binding protein
MVAKKHNFTATEVRAGLLAVVSAAAIIGYIVVIGEINLTPDPVDFEVWFEDTKGLNEGADVRYGGKIVGRVKTIEIEEIPRRQIDRVAGVPPATPPAPGEEAETAADEGLDQRIASGDDILPRIVVSVALNDEININGATSAFITNTTLTSDKHLEITTVWSETDPLTIDETTVVPVDEGDLFGKVNSLLDTVAQEITGLGDLLGVDSSAKVTSVADLLTTLNRAMEQTETLIVSTNDLVDSNRDEIERIIANVLEIEASANAVLQEVHGTVQDARPLVTDSLERVPGLLDQFAEVATTLDELLGQVEPILANTESVTGNLNSTLEETSPELNELVLDIRMTVQNLNDLILMLRENPSSIIRGRPQGRRSAETN